MSRDPKRGVRGGKPKEEQKEGRVLVGRGHTASNRRGQHSGSSLLAETFGRYSILNSLCGFLSCFFDFTMSQCDDNFTSDFEEVSQIPDHFDSQTDPNILQESSILCSRRPTPYKPYDPRWASTGLPMIPVLRAFQPNPNFPMPKETSDASSSTNNIRTEYARSKVPRLHQSSSPSVREVVEQEHGQSKRGYPGVISPVPYKLYDPRWADIGLPVDPILRALELNPNFPMPKATIDESFSTNNIRTDYARSKVPRLHQSSSPSGRVVEQEHKPRKGDYPGVTSPIPYTLYDPRWADIGLPVDPYLRAFKLNPNFGLPKPDK